MKHKKHLRKQGNGGSGGGNGNTSDENCEEKSNDDSIAESGDIDDVDETNRNETVDNRERGNFYFKNTYLHINRVLSLMPHCVAFKMQIPSLVYVSAVEFRE